MIPVLFKGNETNFNHNGIGLLKDTLSCEVSEVRNGSFDLELVYPITGSYFKDLKNGNIIQAKPNDTDQPHNFRITEIDKTLSDKEVVVYGVSITNDLGGNMVKSLYLEDVTPQVILNEMKKVLHYPTTFNFVSNITTIGSVNWELNNPLNLIVGEEGSLVDIFGGEVKRTNDTVYLYGRRGKDNVTTIRAGKNLDGFKMTESFQGKYTQILPYFKYEEEIPGEVSGDTEGETIRQEVTVFGSVVSSPYHGRYPVNAIKPVDFSQNKTVRDAKTLKALNAEAARYFSDLYSEIDKPSVNINVDMIQLVDSEQYELYEKLEKIELTDTVSVYIPEYDVDVLVKITELKYDSLRERTISIVAGSSGRTSLMDEISGSYKQFTKTLVDDKIQSATSGIINQILTKKDGGNVYAGRATPPDNAKKGDIWFKDTGGGDVELYEFDGVNWVRKMYKGFGDDVRQLVDSKIAEANVTITEALEEHDNTIAQAMTKAGQANDLAQQAKTEAANASLSASAANQDAQQAITDAANARKSALSAITEATIAKQQSQKAITDAANAKTEALAQVSIVSQSLDTAKTNLQNQVNAADAKAVKAQAAADSARTDINQQAQTILAQTKAQTALTNRVTTVENLADGTKTTVAELSKTVDKATGDITSVTNRTKVVEDGLAGVKTNYTQLSQTVNTQTGQIQTINRKTADLQIGIDGVTERFENLQVGGENLINNTGKPFVMGYGITNTTWNPDTQRTRLDFTSSVNRSMYGEILPQGSIFYESQNFVLQTGGKYTQAIRISTDAKVLSLTAASITWFHKIVSSGYQSHHGKPATIINTGPNEYIIYSSITWDRENAKIRAFDIHNLHLALDFRNTGTYIEFYKPKLETGNLPTDWRESNTDINNQIAEYKRTADQNYSGLQSTVSTLDGKVTQNKTEANQTATQLSNRLTSVEAYKDGESTRSQSYFEASKTETARQITAERTAIATNYVAKSTYDENVSGTTLKLNEIKTNADTTKQNLATYKNTVDSKLTELTTSTQTLDGKINTASAKVDTVAGQIRTEISTVEGKIPTTSGGRNLAQKTSADWSTPYTNFSGTANNCPILYKVLIDDLVVGNTLKTRIVLKYTNITSASGQTVKMWLQGSGNVTGWNSGHYNSSPARTISGSGEMIFEHEFAITADHLKNAFFTLAFRTDYIASGSLQWKLAKVEKGPLWTAWTPAHEDYDDELSSVKTTITQTSQGVEQLSTSLSTTNDKVTTAETKINQLIGEVSSKVSKTDYNTLNGRVTNAESNITQQATLIASKVSQTDFNAEKTKISNLQTSVTQQSDQIALKASKTELTPITTALNTKVDINQVNSAITTGTSGIRQEVSAVKETLEGGISARNYAVGTATPSVHAVDSRTSTVSSGFVLKSLYSTNKNKTLKELGFTVGDKYTVIFDIYAENNTAFKDYRVEGYKSTGYSHIVGSITNSIGTTTAPTQFVGTSTISSEDHLNVIKWVVRFDLSFMNITVKNFRIFKGEIKQDWYPAWEDQEYALEATKARVDITELSITSLVSGSKTLPDGRTSVFATKIESLEGAITQRVTTQELNNRGYQTSSQVNDIVDNKLPTTIGGRNLAQKTSADWSTPYTNFSGTANNCPILYKVLIDDLVVGNTLKTRIVLKYTNITSASGQTVKMWLQGSGNVTGWNSGHYNSSPARTISGSGEMIFEHEFAITADHLKNAFFTLAFRTDYIASGSLQWKLAKVEKGPLWTAWTPAPEDSDAAITDKLAGYVTNQTYTTYTTARQQTDQQITEQINQTVSKVPTGPVNLVINGFDPQTISPWTSGGSGNSLAMVTHDFFYNSQKKMYMLSTANTNEVFSYTNIFNLKRNTKYTLRVGLFANSATKSSDIYFMGKPTGGSFTYQQLRYGINDLSPSNVVYYTITFDSGSFDLGQFRIDNNGSTTQGSRADLYICEVSCIEGEYNNSWTPSFDELITEQKFNETKSTVDAFSRAIGTRDETGFVPNIARLVMTQDSFISEVAKYGEHNNNLIQDATNHSQTDAIGGSSLVRYPQYDRIDFSKSGATSNVYAGFECRLNTNRLLTGEKYTVSFKYYLYSAPDSNLVIELKDGGTFLASKYTFAQTSTATGVWHDCTYTFTVTSNSAPNSNNIRFKLWVYKNGSVAVEKIMLVRGEKIGPFSTSQVDVVSTRVEQTANSYSIKFLNNANDITTQLNLTNSGTRIKSSLIHLDGNVTVSGTAWMDGAVIKNLSADKITTGTLNANNVNITNLSVDDVSGITATYLQSVIGTAFIDWMKGKVIQGYNDNMTIDLLGGNIILKSGSNAIKRVNGTHTAFVHFNDVGSSVDGGVGSIYASIGVTSSGDGVNSMSSGRFAGLRAFRAASGTAHTATIDQTEIYGDKVVVKDSFTESRGFLIRPTTLDRQYNLNDDVLNPIRFFVKLLLHLNNVGWNWQDRAFIDALRNEWNTYGMSRYGTFRNNTIYDP